MREGWEIKTLNEICEIYNGSTPLRKKKENWDNGVVNWFTINDIRNQGREINFTSQKISKIGFESSSLKLLPKKTVLLCCTASVGEYALTNIELTTNQQFNGLVVKNTEQIIPKYLFYFASTLKQKLLNVSGKTTIDFVSMTKLKKIQIPIPQTEEQKEIVEILDKAFESIEKAKANIEKNIENAKELFQSKLNQIFSQTGEGWEETQLGKIYDVRDGTHDSPKYQQEGYPLITSKNLKNSDINYDKVKFISKLDFDNINKRSKVDIGDILFAMIGTIGNPVVVKEQPDFAIKNVALFKVPIGQSSLFLKYFLDYSTEKMIKESKGSTQRFVGLGYLRKYIINVPSLTKQKEIVETLDIVDNHIQSLLASYEEELKNLEELKKSILQKAFSGELTNKNKAA